MRKALYGLLAAVMLLLGATGGGFYLGHVKYPPVVNPTADPQVCFNTQFTPFVDGTETYINWLDSVAKKGVPIYVADFTFTDDRVVAKYIELHKAGSPVYVILDLLQSRSVDEEATHIANLRAAGIEVQVGTSPAGGIMHNKFTVTGPWVEDGSWNYTEAANKQANVLNMNTCPSPMRADMFRDVWKKLHDHMVTQTQKREERARKKGA